MIYWDNAATTYPKPPAVRQAVGEALMRYGANPGRGGHTMAMQSAAQVYACREALADFFGLDDPSQVVFTNNCTGSLNTVIKGLLRHGGHVVTSDVEHNSVIRPLRALAEAGVTVTQAEVFAGEPTRTVESFRRALRPHTRLVLCTHASNVCGWRLPIREIGALCAARHIPFAVDAAQSAGLLPLNMQQDNIDFLCMPGHKALYGPMGTGVLLCRGKVPLIPLTEGGTGSLSMLAEQPDDLPDRLESGTLNVPGICGLYAGVRFVAQRGVETLVAQETAVTRRLYDALAGVRGIRLYTPRPDTAVCVPMVTLNVEALPSEQTAALLSRRGVAVRAGLHCAPGAHRRLGTLPNGAVRLCPSAFTTTSDADNVAKMLREIARKSLLSTQSVLQ